MEKDWTCSVWLMQQQTVKEDSHLLQGHNLVCLQNYLYFISVSGCLYWLCSKMSWLRAVTLQKKFHIENNSKLLLLP